MDYIFIIAWFALLIKWADYMVEWASSIAKNFWISNLVIWLTVIAFWTSAPELVTSMMSAFDGNADLAISNVIWSNISNLLLILWTTAFVYPIVAPKDTFFKEIPFMLASCILFLLLVIYEPEMTITKPDAWILMMFFCVFLYYIFRQATAPKKETLLEKIKKPKEESVIELPKWKSIVFTIWWLAGLVIWWKLIVDWAVSIAQTFNIPNSFIWVTIIAIWTSLPELASSVAAALKKNTDMAIGWIIWSNIFNSLWILWATWTLVPLKAYEWVAIDAYFNVFVILLVSILLYIWNKKYTIWKFEWLLLVCVYFGYIGYLINGLA